DVLLGADLVAHEAEGRDARADEHDADRGALLRELRVLGEEAVAGVDGLCPARPSRGDDRVGVEVAVVCGRRADAYRLVRERDVPGIPIGVAVDRDTRDAERAQRADDAAGDLAAVGYEDPLEHPRHILNRPKEVSGRGLLEHTSSASPSTVRVSAGSMMPSSQSRAVE